MSPAAKQADASTERNEFEQLLEKVRAGCQMSAHILYEQYTPHVQLVVRRCLSKRVRSFLDSADLTQSVWQDIFALALQDTTFTDPQQFIAFLTGMAQNKVLQAHRKQFDAQKREQGRQQSLDTIPQTAFIDYRPSPEEALSKREELQKRIQAMPENIRGAMTLLARGASVAEVAAELRVSERTVYRLLEVARQDRSQVPEPGTGDRAPPIGP